MKSFILTIVLVSATFSFGQGFTSEETRQDLNFLKSAMETYQPGLLTFNPNYPNDATTLLKALPGDSLSLTDYYKWVSRFCVLGGEGHYLVGDWEDTIRKGIPKNAYRFLPIDVVLLDGKVYVEKDMSEEQDLPLGTEILSINDQYIGEILQQLYYCIPADGHILTQVEHTLDQSFGRDYYFFIDQPETFVIKAKDSIGNIHQRYIKALTLKEQRDNLREYRKMLKPCPKTSNSVYAISGKEGYALLKLKSFNQRKLADEDIKAKKFYKSFFDSLQQQKVPNLIIDLRGNLGGKFEMATEMVPFIMQGPGNDDFIRKSTSWKGKEKKYKMKKPSGLAFKGAIFVLVDGNTFSSGSTLARYLKEYGNAVVIGEETGTRYEGFAAGSRQYVTLPNSGIRIGIPRYLIDFPESQIQKTQNRGLIPDHRIQYNIEDHELLRDLHLEKALELIKQ